MLEAGGRYAEPRAEGTEWAKEEVEGQMLERGVWSTEPMEVGGRWPEVEVGRRRAVPELEKPSNDVGGLAN
eukprot:8230053-Pyramimonas_sp.AAC.1